MLYLSFRLLIIIITNPIINNTAPTITQSFPANGAVNVTIDSKPQIVFSEEIAYEGIDVHEGFFVADCLSRKKHVVPVIMPIFEN